MRCSPALTYLFYWEGDSSHGSYVSCGNGKGHDHDHMEYHCAGNLPQLQFCHLWSSLYQLIASIRKSCLLQGLRVLALATRLLPCSQREFSGKDESDMLFRGFFIFLDPPKASALPAIAKLHDLGIQIKVRSFSRTTSLEIFLADGLSPSMLVYEAAAMSDSTGLRQTCALCGRC